MRRLNREDGAVTVVVALLLVVLVGIGALAIDVGNLYWERRQLQNGADAAALAAAQEYAAGGSGAAAEAAARQFADENNRRGAFVEEYLPELSAGSVTVVTRTGQADAAGTLTSWLAQVVGHEDYFARARATAVWGSMGGGNTIPLTFSYCEWSAMTGLVAGATPEEIAAALPTDVEVIYHHTSSASEVNDCDGPAGQDTSGGFGWLDESGPCEAYVENGEVEADTGASMSQACRDTFEDLIGQRVFMPIFVEVTGSGTNSIYQIGGFAGFEFHGYRFPGAASDPRPCNSPNTCVSGRFVEYYDLGALPAAGPTIEFGAYVVGLSG